MPKKRKINEIIIHCTDTEFGVPVTDNDLYQWHVVERGFSAVGYHYVIHADGHISSYRSLWVPGAHCKGHNKHSIGICYVGGRVNGSYVDTRTIPQKESLNNLIESLCNRFPITKISGHNEYARKSCPCFNANKEYKHLINKLL